MPSALRVIELAPAWSVNVPLGPASISIPPWDISIFCQCGGKPRRIVTVCFRPTMMSTPFVESDEVGRSSGGPAVMRTPAFPRTCTYPPLPVPATDSPVASKVMTFLRGIAPGVRLIISTPFAVTMYLPSTECASSPSPSPPPLPPPAGASAALCWSPTYESFSARTRGAVIAPNSAAPAAAPANQPVVVVAADSGGGFGSTPNKVFSSKTSASLLTPPPNFRQPLSRSASHPPPLGTQL